MDTAYNSLSGLVIRADEPGMTKADYINLAAHGHLRCSGFGHDGHRCPSAVTHVLGGYVNGAIIERAPYFRTDDVDAHSPGCEHIDEPSPRQRAASLLYALENNLPAQINVNIGDLGRKTGTNDLSTQFNALVTRGLPGVWAHDAWYKPASVVSVPASDVGDVLHYLEMAKAHGGARGGKEGEQKALRLLYFNTGGLIQSCARFVAGDVEARMPGLVQEFMSCAQTLPRLGGKACDDVLGTPRLFRFDVRDTQVRKAAQETAFQLYGEGDNLPIRLPGGVSGEHFFIPGMRFKKDSGLDNQLVLNTGRKHWVIAAPLISDRKLREVEGKITGTRAPDAKPVGAGYVFLRVINPAQIAPLDAAPRKPAQPVVVSDQVSALHL